MTDEGKKEEVEPATPRACGACGGRGCKWCTMGYQDEAQQADWSRFRERMRKISSTYSLLEKVVRELIGGLEAAGQDEMAARGKECLNVWMTSSPDTRERREASMKMSLFQSEAVVELMKAQSKAPNRRK